MTSVSLDRIANALGMTESKTPDTHIWATVSSINEDGSYQVQFNGAGTTTRAAKVCNAEVGDRVLCVVANGQVSAIGTVGGGVTPIANGGTGQTAADEALAALGGVAIDLLWTNASPTSSFAPQRLPSSSGTWDLGKYNYLLIVTKCAISTYYQVHILKKGVETFLFMPAYTNFMRSFLVNSDHILAGDAVCFGSYGSWATVVNNDWLVPVQIYGIKGVN